MCVPRLPDIVHPVAAFTATAASLRAFHHKLDVSQHAGKLPPHVGYHVQGRVAQRVSARILAGRLATTLRGRGQALPQEAAACTGAPNLAASMQASGLRLW